MMVGRGKNVSSHDDCAFCHHESIFNALICFISDALKQLLFSFVKSSFAERIDRLYTAHKKAVLSYELRPRPESCSRNWSQRYLASVFSAICSTFDAAKDGGVFTRA
jgi:hypothetical protein